MNYSPFLDPDEYIEALEAQVKYMESLLKEAVAFKPDAEWLGKVTELLDLPEDEEE